MIPRPRLLLLSIGVLLAAVMAAPCLDAEETPPAEHALDRVAVIGASASAGFGVVLRYQDEMKKKKYLPITLKEIVKASIDHDGLSVSAGGSGSFFWNPVQIGNSQKEEALNAKPTLVLAMDYLFWYGYGSRGPAGKPVPRGPDGLKARLALLNLGLGNLESFTCPIILGDFPDVSDAVGRMLSPSQIPSPSTLEALNARVRSWASGHPNVILLPVNRLMEYLRSEDAFEAGQQQWPAGSKSRFMQDDNLHPRLEGLIILLQEAAIEFAKRHPDQAWPLELDLDRNHARIYQAYLPDGCIPAPYEHDE